jgi:hypothetical protein
MKTLSTPITLKALEESLHQVAQLGPIPDEFRMHPDTFRLQFKPQFVVHPSFRSGLTFKEAVCRVPDEFIRYELLGMKIIEDFEIPHGEVEVRDCNGNLIELIRFGAVHLQLVSSHGALTPADIRLAIDKVRKATGCEE